MNINERSMFRNKRVIDNLQKAEKQVFTNALDEIEEEIQQFYRDKPHSLKAINNPNLQKWET